MNALFARYGRKAGVLALAALAGLVGLGFLFIALYVGLSGVMPEAAAALCTGMVALFLALVLVLIARGRHRPRPPPGALVPATLGPAAVAGEAAGVLMRTRPMTVATAALATGFLIAVSPRLRRSLWRLLQ